MSTPTKRPTMPNTDAPRKKPRSDVDMVHLVASMSADDVPVTTPTKPKRPMQEPKPPKAPRRKPVTAVRRVGTNRLPFDPYGFLL